MECIICQDTGSEKLQENTLCPCKYKCHPSCWIDYAHSKIPITCPLCRKDLSVKRKPTAQTPLIQPSAPPYAPEERTVTQENGRQITYQEFVEIIRQHTTNENTVIEVRPVTITQSESRANQLVSQKVFKVIMGLAIVALIIVLFAVFLK
jgi:hypothetical protein